MIANDIGFIATCFIVGFVSFVFSYIAFRPRKWEGLLEAENKLRGVKTEINETTRAMMRFNAKISLVGGIFFVILGMAILIGVFK